MPRIPELTRDEMNAAQQRVYDKIVSGVRKVPPSGPLVAAMHNADLAEVWSRMGEVLRFNSSLSERLREFTILATGRYWSSQFEWFAHEPIARRVGLSAQSIEALRHDTGRFDDPEEQLIYDYASTLLKKHAVDEALYERARAHFGTGLLIELTALIGYYCMVCSTLNAHNFDVPAGTAQPLPPL